MEQRAQDFKPKAPFQKKRKSSELDIVVMSGMGRVRKFRISSWILWVAGIFLLVYFIGSIFVIHQYMGLRKRSHEVANELKRLKASEEELKKRLFQAHQKMAFLKDYISTIPPESLAKKQVSKAQKKGSPKKPPATPKQAISSSKPKEAQASEKKKSEAKVQDQARKPQPRPAAKPEPQPKVRLDIRRFSTRQDQSHIAVIFRLYKLTRGTRPAEGYVHLLALNEKHDPPLLGSWPPGRLKGGVPEDFKTGEPFLIRKSYRTIKGKFTISSPETLPEIIRILVYDKQGRILLDKKLPCKLAQKRKLSAPSAPGSPPNTPPP